LAASKAPEALFDLDTEQSVTTIHNCHLTPTFNLLEEDDNSEGSAPAANPRPATPPRKNTNKEAARNENLSSMASPPHYEEVGVMHAADGG
jgi:hypothetical protein